MPALSEYSSVTNTVFNILNKKGYRFWYNEKIERYCAEKDGWDFMSRTPCGLLGIISIYEFKKPEHYYEYWWKEDEQDFIENLSKVAPVYESVINNRNSK